MTEFHKAAIAVLEYLSNDGLQKQIATNPSFAQTLKVKQGPLALATLDLFKNGAFDVIDPKHLRDLAGIPWMSALIRAAAREVLNILSVEDLPESKVSRLPHLLRRAESKGKADEYETYATLLKTLFFSGVEAKITSTGYKLLGAYKKAMSDEKRNIIQNIGDNNTNIIGNENRVTNASQQGLDIAQSIELLDKVLALVESNTGEEKTKELVRTDVASLRTELQRSDPIISRLHRCWNTLMQTISGLAAIPGLVEAMTALGAALGAVS